MDEEQCAQLSNTKEGNEKNEEECIVGTRAYCDDSYGTSSE